MRTPGGHLIHLLSGDGRKKLNKILGQCIVRSIVLLIRVLRGQGWGSQRGRKVNFAHRTNKSDNFNAISNFQVLFGDGSGSDATWTRNY